jgi:glycosyltransferase involved in cell wall biosynthesis
MQTAPETNSPRPSTAAPASGARAAVPVAIISNSHAPYRAAKHIRIVREMPDVALWSVFTHEVNSSAWRFDPPDEIRPVLFGKGEIATTQADLSRALHEWRKGGRVIRWVKEQRIGAVLLEGYNDLGRLRILRWCSRNGVPCLLWGDSNIRGDTRRGFRAWVKQSILSRILRRSNAVLACGALGREYFAKYGVPEERIFYFPYEPDYSQIEQMPESAIAEAKSRFSLMPDRRRLVFSGRLAPVKRPELIIDAFVAIAHARPQWDLVMMGTGSMQKSLVERVPPGLRDRVIWTGFIGEQVMVSAVYRSCDVLVLPSDYEPWALVINEAAAAGLAIVASDVVGAAAELVRDGVNGYCFPPGNLEALTNRLLAVTDASSIDTLKHGSAAVLADWRQRGDPITGLRQGLTAAGAFLWSH